MLLPFVFASALIAAEDEFTDEESTAAAIESEADEGRETAAGRVLEARILARSLIDLGLETNSPEAVVTGVQTLLNNPVQRGGEDDKAFAKMIDEEKDQLRAILTQAQSMRPADDAIAELVMRAEESIDETSRGLAGGPRRWHVVLDKEEYFEIDPRLIYNSHEKAIVHAYSPAEATLGIQVRRTDQRKNVAQAVARKAVTATWNSGIYTSGWVVRIYNLSGPDALSVVVETN